MRSGFSMIVAIAVLVMVATIGALTLNLSTQSVKATGDLYLRTQAEILSRSATEFALLALSDHNISDNPPTCIESIDMNFTTEGQTSPLFDINITIWYIGRGLPCSATAKLNNSIETIDSNATVLIDTIVTLNQDTIATLEPIRIHRRTLQKP